MRKPTPGDDQQHHQRKLIEHETKIDMEQARIDPGAVVLNVRQRNAYVTGPGRHKMHIHG